MNYQKDNISIPKPVSINSMTEAEFDVELEKGYQEIIDNSIILAKDAFNNFKKDFNLK